MNASEPENIEREQSGREGRDESAPEEPRIHVRDNRHWARREDGDDSPDEGEEARDLRPAYVKELEQRLEEQTAQLNEYIQAHKQYRLEVESTKNRMEKELRKQLEWERAKAWEPFLEIMDNLERMAHSAQTTSDLDGLVRGCEMIHRQFEDLLAQQGLEEVPAQGEPFDPNRHEALGMMPTDDPTQDGRVVEVASKGYQWEDKLVRPARVMIARKGGATG